MQQPVCDRPHRETETRDFPEWGQQQVSVSLTSTQARGGRSNRQTGSEEAGLHPVA